MLEGTPNFLMVNEQRDKPEDIAMDYFEMINHFKHDNDAVLNLLHEFFDEVNLWTVKQFLIDQAKMNLLNLEQIDKYEHEFIEDGLDDEDEALFFDD